MGLPILEESEIPIEQAVEDLQLLESKTSALFDALVFYRVRLSRPLEDEEASQIQTIVSDLESEITKNRASIKLLLDRITEA